MLDIREFGARGLEGGDDTTAIQSAIDAAELGGGMVYVPPGTYPHDALTVRASGVVIVGVGEASVLKYTGSGWGLTCGGSAGTPLRAIGLRDLRLRSEVPSNPDGLIRLQHVESSVFRDIGAWGLSKESSWAISIEGASYRNRIEGLVGVGGGGLTGDPGDRLLNGIRFAGIAADFPHDNLIYDSCLVGRGDASGTAIENDGFQTSVYGGNFSDFGMGINITRPCARLIAPRFQSCGTGIATGPLGTSAVIFYPYFDNLDAPRMKTSFHSSAPPAMYLSFDAQNPLEMGMHQASGRTDAFAC